MPSSSVYVGIDVACAVGKRLPVCIVAAGFPLMPIEIPRGLSGLIPRGLGNKEVAQADPFRVTAQGVVDSIKSISGELGWQIERIAIDAPAAPPAIAPRTSEVELARRGLSSFATPPASAWSDIRKKCISHLESGGATATLPNANRIWMLFGFELFTSLRSAFSIEIIEVYPFAIARELLETCAHKTTEKGYQDQLAAVAARTGWEPQSLETKLRTTVSGSRHDRLDAFMAAWMASKPPDRRRAYGDRKSDDDAIWVPCD